jgi:hypothetical protein
MSKKAVFKTKEELKQFKFYGQSDLIKMGGKYYTLHIPVPLYNLLGINDNDVVKILVNANTREILLVLEPKGA